MRHNQPLQWKKEEPIFCRKAFTDWARGYAFLSAKPACSSMLLASPVLLKVPSGILSWFKSYFTSCSVIVFWGQHNAMRLLVGGFFPYDIHVLSPLFILLAQPCKAIACTFIAMQMLLDLISSPASYAPVSTLTNCSYSVKWLFTECCFYGGLLLTLFTIYLGLGEEWQSFS